MKDFPRVCCEVLCEVGGMENDCFDDEVNGVMADRQ